MIFQRGYYVVNGEILFLNAVEDAASGRVYFFKRRLLEKDVVRDEDVSLRENSIKEMTYYWLQQGEMVENFLGSILTMESIEYNVDTRQMMVLFKGTQPATRYVRELVKVLGYDLFEKK
jgi:hypothetical protein